MHNLRADERISMVLREMYQQHGYLPYKVNKFEEYDLYMRNKRFLPSEHVLAFADRDGKLMALKPDVTLSIIKNTKDDGQTAKVSYAERVYRVPRGGSCFKEIMQAGLEVIGPVDAYTMGEVMVLAAKSLLAISERCALDVADLGIVSGILAQESLEDRSREQILALISDRNLHELKALCGKLGLGEKTTAQLCSLVTVYGPMDEVLPLYEKMDLPQTCAQALAHLRAVLDMTCACGITNINLDFSVVNDMNYYNGLIFSGFVDGIPHSVLSGGQYDALMRRMGRSSQAMGFAVYLDQLDRLLDKRADSDVDVLITYTDVTPVEAILAAARQAEAQGKSIRVQREGATAVRSRSKLAL